MKNLIKKILRFQHKHLPLPLIIYKYLFINKKIYKFFYKYYLLCYDTDVNNDNPTDTQFNQSYWLSKRALYWHYTHLHHNRFTTIVDFVYKKFNHLFKGKKNLRLDVWNRALLER